MEVIPANTNTIVAHLPPTVVNLENSISSDRSSDGVAKPPSSLDDHVSQSDSIETFGSITAEQQSEAIKPDEQESPQVNLAINNVVCTFSTRCHLNLKVLALNGDNVELKKAQGMLNMKLRKPSATASIWSSGKITVTGANSEDNCRIAARRIARIIQKLGFDVKFSSFRIVNVLGTCSLPFGILLSDFSRENLDKVQYEPELHPGATYQIKDIQATLKIFSTGSMTITAPRVENIQLAVEQVFPLVYQFKKPKPVDATRNVVMEDSDYWIDTSDEEDSDLELGEIRNSHGYHVSRGGYSGRGKGYHVVQPVSSNTVNEDDYGSQSDFDDDSDNSLN